MNSFKEFIIILVLLFTRPSFGETIILPIQDFLHEVPNYTNAPRLNLAAAIDGRVVLETSKNITRKTKGEMEKNIINMLWEEYPDALSIRIWRGNLLIKL